MQYKIGNSIITRLETRNLVLFSQYLPILFLLCAVLNLQFTGQSNSPLSEDGVLQAESLSKRLSNEKIDYVYTSDLLRATHVRNHSFFQNATKCLFFNNKIYTFQLKYRLFSNVIINIFFFWGGGLYFFRISGFHPPFNCLLCSTFVFKDNKERNTFRSYE